MDRLTKIIVDGPIKVLSVLQARVGGAAVWKEWSVSKESSIKDALYQLAAYEDTNLTPKEITKAQNAMNAVLGLACAAQAARDENASLRAELEQVKAERDAAVKDIEGILTDRISFTCDVCAFSESCLVSAEECEKIAKWRGVQKEK